MKDYFFKPPINKLSLNFLDQDLEMAYRTSYQEEVCFSFCDLSDWQSLFLTHFFAVDDKSHEMSPCPLLLGIAAPEIRLLSVYLLWAMCSV